jgi:phosphate:Na+ symporter
MCERRCPPAPDQDIARPRYISDAALEDPGSALELVAREHARVVELLPDVLDDARHDGRGQSASRTGEAIASLLDSIESYMRDIMSRQLSADASMHAVALDQRHRALVGLRESIISMVQVARESRRIDPDGQGAMLVGGLVEAFDGNLRTLAEAVRGNDDLEWSVLKEMTEDRGPAMEALRGRLSDASAHMAPDSLRAALYATGVFERGMWLVRQQVALR